MPLASKISASFNEANFPGVATSFTVSPSSSTSIAASVLEAGSITRPFVISSMLGVLLLRSRILRSLIGGTAVMRRRLLRFCGWMYAVAGIAGNQQIQDGHSYRHSVCHLLEHTGLRTVGYVRRNLDAAIHRARMQYQRIGLGALEAFGIQLIAVDIVIRGNRRLVLSFGLHAQHDNHVCTFESFFNFVHAADRSARGDFLKLPRNPHRRTAQREFTAEFAE